MWDSKSSQDTLPEDIMDAFEIPENNAVAHLLYLSKTQPAVPLLITRGRNYTYKDFVFQACAFAGLLRNAGFIRGQRVAFFVEEYDHFFVSMIGVWLLGGVVVPINVKLPQRDVEWLIAKAQPAFLIVPDEAVCPITGTTKMVLQYGDNGSLDLGKPLAEGELEPLCPGELAIIMFTSGTTGLPKGVCQTLACISANAGNVALTLGINGSDRIFINTPPYFTSGICHFLTLLAAGGGVAGELGFFFGDSLLDMMEKLGCTGFGGGPTHLIRVVEPMSAPREHNFRFWVSSGDHLPIPVAEKLRCMLPGVRLFNMYGLTEVGGRLCILSPEASNVGIGSVGRPIADMVVVARDSRGALVSAGDVGELYVTGSLLMQGYLGEPEITAKTLTDRGLRTGDFGCTDEVGNVWVSGRKDDIIKCGGEKVSIVHVQQAIMELGVFTDVAVIATPHELLGHVPVAFVVPKNPDNFKVSKFLLALKKLLPIAFLPSRVVTVNEIPRTGSGKAIRSEMQKLLKGGN